MMNDDINDIDDVVTDKLRQEALPLPPVALPFSLHRRAGAVTVRRPAVGGAV